MAPGAGTAECSYAAGSMETDGEERQKTTILVPLDDSALSQRALPTAAWLARGLGAEVMLVTVEPFPESEAQRVEERAAAHQFLRRASSALAGLTVRAVLSTHYDPAKGILSVIAEDHPDLVVMSTMVGAPGRACWTAALPPRWCGPRAYPSRSSIHPRQRNPRLGAPQGRAA